MVRKLSSNKRFAFTMIELIFAIVIIAISVMSLPMMAQVNQKGIEQGILQEAIFAASAELMGASAGIWDKRSLDDEALSDIPRVINISGDCTADKRRPGHVTGFGHRQCLFDNTTVLAINTATGATKTLHHAAHGSQNIFTDTTTDKDGYKQSYNSTLIISNTNDIKFLESAVYDTSGTLLLVKLKMQTANIGGIDYYTRKMP